MSLRERLSEVADTAAVAEVRPESPVSRAGRDAIKRNLHYLLIEEMGTELNTSTDEAVTRRAIETKLTELIGRESTPLSLADRREISTDVIDNILGYGPLQSLLEDPEVTEIMVNDPATVYVERRGL
ncbi:MAG: CpaF family protein, partial [Actinomycetota bacterium]|nr:CpaF family protein [Actinomycetota bacterium]